MDYTASRSQRPQTEPDTRKELMELYNNGDMAEHPSLFLGPVKSVEQRTQLNDSNEWRV